MSHLGIAGSYEARQAGPAQLADALAELRNGQLDGINVTMPLKREAARVAGRLTPEARAGESVNTLRFRDSTVEGHSTDVTASTQALQDPRFEPNAPVLILGAGGAAAAAVVGAGTRRLYLAARDPNAAKALGRLASGPVEVVHFGVGVAGALVLNATPIGMAGEELPDSITNLAAGLIDLAYGSAPTPAVLRAQEQRLPVMDGVEFLVLQAAGSFEWWTGISAPLQVMMEAARKV
jgi:shikimate dehydrogenase